MTRSPYDQTPEMAAYWRAQPMEYWLRHSMMYLWLWMGSSSSPPEVRGCYQADFCIGIMAMEAMS